MLYLIKIIYKIVPLNAYRKFNLKMSERVKIARAPQNLFNVLSTYKPYHFKSFRLLLLIYKAHYLKVYARPQFVFIYSQKPYRNASVL